MKLASLLLCEASSLKIRQSWTTAQYFFTDEPSGLPAADLKCRQMAGDVAGVKRGTSKGADGVGSAGGLALMPHGGVVEVRPEDRPWRS